MKKSKKNKELIHETESNDPLLKEVIEYENEDGEEIIKDLSKNKLDKK